MGRTYATVKEAEVLVGKLVKMDHHVGIVKRVFRYIDHYGPSQYGSHEDNRPVMEIKKRHEFYETRLYTDKSEIEIAGE